MHFIVFMQRFLGTALKQNKLFLQLFQLVLYFIRFYGGITSEANEPNAASG